MTEDQIKHMVDRFLGWRLPDDFRPDAGISFEPEFNKEYMATLGQPPMRHNPVGTNLLDATQADIMVRYMIDGLPLTRVPEIALTNEVIDQGAQRLASFEDGSVWPDSWDKLDVMQMRIHAERCIRSALVAMGIDFADWTALAPHTEGG